MGEQAVFPENSLISCINKGVAIKKSVVYVQCRQAITSYYKKFKFHKRGFHGRKILNSIRTLCTINYRYSIAIPFPTSCLVGT